MKKQLCLFTILCLLISLLSIPTVSAKEERDGRENAFRAELKAVAAKTYKYYQDHTDPETG
ncbi:hypothetical protein HP456_21705, partial [Bacillus haikouensis]|nr:hypothetical protein [Bacillus haikouensis]